MSACSCDARGEDIACPTHGAEATIRELQAENELLREELRDASPGWVQAQSVRLEAARLRAENERYRAAIKTALDIMATSNDMQLGPGGVARKAYAHLWHEFFAIPAGIPASTIGTG